MDFLQSPTSTPPQYLGVFTTEVEAAQALNHGSVACRSAKISGKTLCRRYLGLFTTEIEAAQAYDRESVACRGIEAVTNFDLGEYAALLSPEDLAEARARGLFAARWAPPTLQS